MSEKIVDFRQKRDEKKEQNRQSLLGLFKPKEAKQKEKNLKQEKKQQEVENKGKETL